MRLDWWLVCSLITNWSPSLNQSYFYFLELCVGRLPNQSRYGLVPRWSAIDDTLYQSKCDLLIVLSCRNQMIWKQVIRLKELLVKSKEVGWKQERLKDGVISQSLTDAFWLNKSWLVGDCSNPMESANSETERAYEPYRTLSFPIQGRKRSFQSSLVIPVTYKMLLTRYSSCWVKQLHLNWNTRRRCRRHLFFYSHFNFRGIKFILSGIQKRNK